MDPIQNGRRGRSLLTLPKFSSPSRRLSGMRTIRHAYYGEGSGELTLPGLFRAAALKQSSSREPRKNPSPREKRMTPTRANQKRNSRTLAAKKSWADRERNEGSEQACPLTSDGFHQSAFPNRLSSVAFLRLPFLGQISSVMFQRSPLLADLSRFTTSRSTFLLNDLSLTLFDAHRCHKSLSLTRVALATRALEEGINENRDFARCPWRPRLCDRSPTRAALAASDLTRDF